MPSLEQTKPMPGTSGVRLGVLHPEIYEMQGEPLVVATVIYLVAISSKHRWAGSTDANPRF